MCTECLASVGEGNRVGKIGTGAIRRTHARGVVVSGAGFALTGRPDGWPSSRRHTDSWGQGNSVRARQSFVGTCRGCEAGECEPVAV